MRTGKNLLSESIVLAGLVAFALLERQVGLPIMTWMLGMVVARSLSTKARLMGGMILGSYLATLYLTPLWLGVLVVSLSWWVFVRVVEKWQTLSCWLISIVGLVALFQTRLVDQQPLILLLQVLGVFLLQHSWRWGRWYYRVQRSLRAGRQVKVLQNAK